MNVLLTGGAGYIGSHTAMALKGAGFTPVVLDSLVKGHKWAVKYGPFAEGDIAREDLVREICAAYRPAAVIHFAAFIDVAESVAERDKYMQNNFHKAARLFDTVLACGVDKVVFSSTAAVYGTPRHDGPLSETDPLLPINPYGESKLAAETYLRSMGAQGMRSVALRYFNAAGAAPSKEEIGEAHNPETHLIPNVIRAGLERKEPVKIFGTDYPTPDGTAVRDYIHVIDLAAAHIAALRYLLDDGATAVFNLGTGQGSSVQEVIKAVEKTLMREVPCQREGRREGDPPRLVADASRAKKVLGWEPRRTLDAIVESAAQWHRSLAYRRAVGV